MITKHSIYYLLLIFTFSAIWCAWAGEVKLTTYYPAPYGEYKQLKTTGLLQAGGNYYNVVSWNYNGTPTNGVKIKTNIPYTNGSQMPTIIIEGYDYGTGNPMGISLVWYVYGGVFTHYKASSWGNTAPTIKLASENGLVTIWLDWKPYYGRMAVKAFAQGMLEQPSWFNGWTVVDGVAGTTNQVTVSYYNTFGNVGIGTTTPQGGLHVSGSPKGLVYITQANAAVDSKHWYFDAEGGALYWGVNNDAFNSGTNYAKISRSGNSVTSFDIMTNAPGGAAISAKSTGNVGIGTASPTQKLDVNGIIRVGAQGGLLYTTTPGNFSGKQLVLTVADGAGTNNEEIWIGPNTNSLNGHIQLSANRIHMNAPAGVRLPNMTQAAMKNIANPLRGLMVYNTGDDHLYYYNGTGWVQIASIADTIAVKAIWLCNDPKCTKTIKLNLINPSTGMIYPENFYKKELGTIDHAHLKQQQ